MHTSIADNLAVIRERISSAARRANRDANSIALMAVCKGQPVEHIREAYRAGQRLFGENRVQEFAAKATALEKSFDASFHLIGHLQSNKAAKAVSLFDAIDSVDSLRLAERLDAAAQAANKRLPVLIEINIGGETEKAGVLPDSAMLEEMLQAATRLSALEVRGLMTIPPFTADPEQARPYFRRLRALRDEIAARHLPAVGLSELSMGMSHDFAIAVEEGATCVRVGTAIFGERRK